MPKEEQTLIGVGIYSIAEASRLSQVHRNTIARWLRGYSYRLGDDRRYSPQVIKGGLLHAGGANALRFKDLIEVRFVDAFRHQGVSWKVLRKASERAAELLETTHPFSTKRFLTDGQRILGEMGRERGAGALLDVIKDQYVFREILAPYLRGLERSDQDEVLRWWPLERRGGVVLDPERSFGQPIISDEGVSTNVLYRAFKAEGAVDPVARWFDVKPKSVRLAIEYEKHLAAA